MTQGGQSKYILGQRIAQGGMAEIYLGKIVGAEGFNRICAFKKILPHFAEDEEFVQMFRNEAMVAKQLQHKNIVQVYDFDSSGSQGAMLVMEYVEGENLKSLMMMSEKQRLRIPPELACYVAAEVLTGLGYAHAAVDFNNRPLGIIHRDVSPQNVLLSFEGDVKITDFGIAKASNAGNMTRAGVLKGKFRYMSPEQANGQPLDPRSDIFAVGVVLYEMLTMTHLFKGDNDLEILQAARDCKVRSPNSIKGTSIPTELESIVMRFLQKDPKARYQVAKDAAKDLMRFVYSFKPDFFAGELSDFMQKVFAERMSATRERMRSTLALPLDSVRASQPGQNRSDQGGVPVSSLSLGFGDGASSSDELRLFHGQKGVSMPPASQNRQIVLQPEENAPKLEVATSHRDSPDKLTGRPVRRTGTHTRIPATRVTQRKAAPFPWERFVVAAAVLLAVSGAGFVYAIKQRVLRFTSHLELRASVPSQKRVKVRVNGQWLQDGGWIDLPISLSLESGKNQIVVSKPGFREQEIVFNAPPLGSFMGGTRTENVLLGKDAPLGAVLIFTDPENAKVSIDDGQFTGRSGQQIDFVPVGRRYRIAIEHSRCSRMVGEIEIPASAAGEMFTKQYSLKNCK